MALQFSVHLETAIKIAKEISETPTKISDDDLIIGVISALSSPEFSTSQELKLASKVLQDKRLDEKLFGSIFLAVYAKFPKLREGNVSETFATILNSLKIERLDIPIVLKWILEHPTSLLKTVLEKTQKKDNILTNSLQYFKMPEVGKQNYVPPIAPQGNKPPQNKEGKSTFGILMWFVIVSLLLVTAAFGATSFLKLETVPTYMRAIVSVIILILWFNSNFKILSAITGKLGVSLKNSFKKVKSSFGDTYILYLIRVSFFPLLALGIIWTFSLTPSPVWMAILSICGYFVAYDVVRNTLQGIDNKLTSMLGSAPGFIIWIGHLLSLNWIMLAPLMFGYFLMWYFNWLPFATWVNWVYGIYGGIIFLINLVIILSPKNKSY